MIKKKKNKNNISLEFYFTKSEISLKYSNYFVEYI